MQPYHVVVVQVLAQIFYYHFFFFFAINAIIMSGKTEST